jgi:hypothetical protein
MSRASGVTGLALIWLGCAASGESTRPPNVAPPPSQASISILGFDEAVRLGSDYVYTSTGSTNLRLASSQELPGGLLELNFDLGPGARPVRVIVDRGTRQVTSMEHVQPIPGVVEPAPPR